MVDMCKKKEMSHEYALLSIIYGDKSAIESFFSEIVTDENEMELVMILSKYTSLKTSILIWCSEEVLRWYFETRGGSAREIIKARRVCDNNRVGMIARTLRDGGSYSGDGEEMFIDLIEKSSHDNIGDGVLDLLEIVRKSCNVDMKRVRDLSSERILGIINHLYSEDV